MNPPLQVHQVKTIHQSYMQEVKELVDGLVSGSRGNEDMVLDVL